MYTNMCREDISKVVRDLEEILENSKRSLEVPETAILWDRVHTAKDILSGVVSAIDEVVE